MDMAALDASSLAMAPTLGLGGPAPTLGLDEATPTLGLSASTCDCFNQ